MAKLTDIALVGGLGVLAFLAIRAGRDLFGALPQLGQGLSDSISNLQQGFSEQISATQEGFADALESTQDFFGQQFGNLSESFQQQIQSLQGLQQSDQPVNIVFNEEQQQIADNVGKQIDELDCKCGTAFKQDAQGNVDVSCIPCEQGEQFERADPDDPRFQEGQGEIIPRSEVDEIERNFPIESPAQTEIERQMPRFQQAEGGSFVGGAILETPIENLSLGQIIDKFGVTASQAADIKAQATDDFPKDFDFGTNTGNAEFAATREIPEFGSFQGGGITGDESFQGLSPEDIMKQILGGNINNF